MNDSRFDLNHKRMIDEQIIRRGIHDERILRAMQAVPRHLFVPEENAQNAYDDGPLPIGFGQTISQPYIVALMVSGLQLQGSEHVLEIGTGCGYQTAVLANLAGDVVSIEIIPELAERAAQIIHFMGIKNVNLITGDGSQGWSSGAPYDGILISASAPHVPPPLLEQMAEGGRLILPAGSRDLQQLDLAAMWI
jgi:protein-L-isoaspartate(D-aspartate) O-methyltransferase